MALQQVNFGSASDGSQGDTARAAFGKINQNFSDTTNAASRLVGTASGNVMEVGAFGLGASSLPLLANIDTMNTPPGDYRVTTATAGTVPTSFGVLRVDSHALGTSNDNWANQTLYGTNGKVYYRSSINLAAWSVWKEIPTAVSPTFSGTLGFTGGLFTFAPSTAVNASLEFGYTGGAATNPFIDFHSGATATDYDFRISANGGNGSVGGGNLALSGGILDLGCSTICRLPLRAAQYTLASMPSASAYTGYEIDVTDAAGGAKRCRSDGTNWKIINTTTTVS